ncbi:MAG: class I SAM-dependent rRNA methyltransferase [Rubrivivax sp.]|nr:class I SAM-dependent rRNA methyltransferase [Rubrivivax sp.]
MKSIRLVPGKERSLQRCHPWVFAGSVGHGKADAGETVRVEAADGSFLAWGAYSPASSIRVRVWSFDEAERIDAAFFQRRIGQAVALRERLAIPSSGRRLIHGEADGLPGLIVDRYGDLLCAQFSFTGSERWKDAIADALMAATGAARLYERSDAGVRSLEGLPPQTGWLRGQGDTTVAITEHGWQLTLDVGQGHKTGFYLDQRDNRAALAGWVQRLGLCEVLNAYCYTGGFTVAALAGGAQQVTSVDSSGPALAQVQAHVRLNGFDDSRSHCHEADVNAFLRSSLEAGRRFDAIVLDPPKLAPTAAHAERAARAYKDINRLAFKLLAPGGLLMTFSCSGGISADLFHKIVAGAAADVPADGAILQRLEAACDHPSTMRFPEGEYLKGLAILKSA